MDIPPLNWTPLLKKQSSPIVENFVDQAQTLNIVQTVFIGIGLMVAAALIAVLFIWAWQKGGAELFIGVYSVFVLAYVAKVVTLIGLIREKLREFYKQGYNPDVTKLVVNVDSTKYKVDWEATIEESKDGKAYVGFSTIGSAGSGADSCALNQVDAMKKWVDGAKDYTLVLDFKNTKGIYIRQLFYKYTKPTEFTPH